MKRIIALISIFVGIVFTACNKIDIETTFSFDGYEYTNTITFNGQIIDIDDIDVDDTHGRGYWIDGTFDLGESIEIDIDASKFIGRDGYMDIFQETYVELILPVKNVGEIVDLTTNPYMAFCYETLVSGEYYEVYPTISESTNYTAYPGVEYGFYYLNDNNINGCYTGTNEDDITNVSIKHGYLQCKYVTPTVIAFNLELEISDGNKLSINYKGRI